MQLHCADFDLRFQAREVNFKAEPSTIEITDYGHPEEITFTARPKIHSHSQIYRYGRSIFCLPQRPKFSDIFDLCLRWVSVVREHGHFHFDVAPLYSGPDNDFGMEQDNYVNFAVVHTSGVHFNSQNVLTQWSKNSWLKSSWSKSLGLKNLGLRCPYTPYEFNWRGRR